MSEQNGSSKSSNKVSGWVWVALFVAVMMAFAPDEMHVLSDWILNSSQSTAIANPTINVNVEAPNFDGLAKALGDQAKATQDQNELISEGNDIQKGVQQAQKRAADALQKEEDCAAQIRDTPALIRFVEWALGYNPCQ